MKDRKKFLTKDNYYFSKIITLFREVKTTCKENDYLLNLVEILHVSLKNSMLNNKQTLRQ